MRAYLFNLLIAIDQLGNALCAGDPDETISSRLGRKKLRAYLEGGPWGPLDALLDQFLDWCDPRTGSHILNAIEVPVELPPGARFVFDHTGRIVGIVQGDLS